MRPIMETTAMINRLTALFLAIILFAPVASAGTQEQAITLLSGRHDLPTAEQIRGLGSEAATLLQAIADNEENLLFLRVRAIGALGYFDDEQTAVYLTQSLKRNHHPAMRSAGLSALSASQKGAAVELISGYQKDGDPMVSNAARTALKSIGTPEALSRLTEPKTATRQKEPKLEKLPD